MSAFQPEQRKANRLQRVSTLQDQLGPFFMQYLVNNKKLYFGDKFSSCSDVATTERFYMQI